VSASTTRGNGARRAARSGAHGAARSGAHGNVRSGSQPVAPEPRTLSDPGAIKALAHPARLAVLEALADGAELTATECAAAAGISPSAMSYHLRALEKWGFVERAEASADGRERPWRSVPGGWRVDAMPDPASATAADAVVAAMLRRLRADLSNWFDAERDQPEAWRDVATVENRALWMTPEEAKELMALHADFVQQRRARTTADHPETARRVRMVSVVVPLQFE
jgi:DNA-binding transcriptional ArsR family regulator